MNKADLALKLEDSNASENDKQKIMAFADLLEVIKDGYGGIINGGQLVDRRKNPEAIPLQENSYLNCPKPKPIYENYKNIKVGDEVFVNNLEVEVKAITSEYGEMFIETIYGSFNIDICSKEKPLNK